MTKLFHHGLNFWNLGSMQCTCELKEINKWWYLGKSSIRQSQWTVKGKVQVNWVYFLNPIHAMEQLMKFLLNIWSWEIKLQMKLVSPCDFTDPLKIEIASLSPAWVYSWLSVAATETFPNLMKVQLFIGQGIAPFKACCCFCQVDYKCLSLTHILSFMLYYFAYTFMVLCKYFKVSRISLYVFTIYFKNPFSILT